MSEHRSPSPEYVTVQTPHGPLTLPRVQVEGIAACVQAIRDEGKDPTWHMNACGCCASVHEMGNGHRGYLVGSDGEFDYLEFEHGRETLRIHEDRP